MNELYKVRGPPAITLPVTLRNREDDRRLAALRRENVEGQLLNIPRGVTVLMACPRSWAHFPGLFSVATRRVATSSTAELGTFAVVIAGGELTSPMRLTFAPL